jgi:hypothetical protein
MLLDTWVWQVSREERRSLVVMVNVAWIGQAGLKERRRQGVMIVKGSLKTVSFVH